MKAAVTVKENYEFRRIYRKGRSAVSPYFVVYCLKNRAGASRLGVTVSKKLGHAVVRNRVRRRIRELYRLNRDKMRPGWDVIVVGRGRSAAGPYQKMNEAYLDCSPCCRRRARHEKSMYGRHPVLPAGGFPSISAPVPLYSHLLGVRSGGGGKIRRRKGQLSCRQAYIAMQSLPQGRV